jgi:hypothetical protein
MAALSPTGTQSEQGNQASSGEVVHLCPFLSDSRFSGPGVLQNQLNGKVDAAVVERS